MHGNHPTSASSLDGARGSALVVLIVYVALNVMVRLVRPRFTGDAVRLTRTVAFLSLIVWAFLLGPLGALLAVSVTLFVKLLLVDHSRDGRWVGTLISSTVPRPDRPS